MSSTGVDLSLVLPDVGDHLPYFSSIPTLERGGGRKKEGISIMQKTNLEYIIPQNGPKNIEKDLI